MKVAMNIFNMIRKTIAVLKPFVRSLAVCAVAGLLAGNARAQIAQRGTATTASVTSGTSLTVNKPGGVVQGDVMIVCIAQYVIAN
jgi:hypothetical protein